MGQMAAFLAVEIANRAGHTADLSLSRDRTRTINTGLNYARGQLVGIEVKAGASVGKKDFLGLSVFAELVGSRFFKGIVLYAGNRTVKGFMYPLIGSEKG